MNLAQNNIVSVPNDGTRPLSDMGVDSTYLQTNDPMKNFIDRYFVLYEKKTRSLNILWLDIIKSTTF